MSPAKAAMATPQSRRGPLWIRSGRSPKAAQDHTTALVRATHVLFTAEAFGCPSLPVPQPKSNTSTAPGCGAGSDRERIPLLPRSPCPDKASRSTANTLQKPTWLLIHVSIVCVPLWKLRFDAARGRPARATPYIMKPGRRPIGRRRDGYPLSSRPPAGLAALAWPSLCT